MSNLEKTSSEASLYDQQQGSSVSASDSDAQTPEPDLELMLAADDISTQAEASDTAVVPSTAPLALTVDSLPLPQLPSQRPFAIANAMNQATDLENLYQITVTQLRKRFGVDRALLYQFQADTQGTVIAESLTDGYSPMLGEVVAAVTFGASSGASYQRQPIAIINNLSEEAATPYQVQLGQQFQIKASASLPIFVNGRLWGLLAVQACQTPRQWSDSEIALLYQIGTELTLQLQAYELCYQRQQELTREGLIVQLLQSVRELDSVDQVFEQTTRLIRQHLQTDRVAVFKFHRDSQHGSGQVVAESVHPDYVSARDVAVEDHCFGGSMAEAYRQGRHWAAADIYEEGLPECHISLLAQFQVRANLVVPLIKAGQLWGLFCIHQCRAPRPWQESEISFIQRIAAQLSVALQQAEYLERVNQKSEQLEQIAEQERLIVKIADRLRKTTDLPQTLKLVARDIRQMLDADRVGLFQFDVAANYSVGEFVVEDVAPGVMSAMAAKVTDHCFAEDQAENYSKGRYWVVNDIRDLKLPDCLIDLLSELQVRASLVVPLMKGDILWGLFCIHACQGPRQWQKAEVDFAHRIGAQLNLALKQADYIDQVHEKNQQLERVAEQERLITNIADRLRQTTDLPQTLKMTVRDIRQMLAADRVGLFQFDVATNYRVGEFVVEDVAAGVMSAMAAKVTDHCFAEDQAENYSKGRYWVVDDVQNLDLPDCLVDLLSELQVRASLVVPLMKGDILWGLFCIHACQGPRQWREDEVEFAHRIGAQLNLALKQADYLDQLQEKNAALAATAEREKQSKEQFQQQVMQLLSDVYPALEGDLTVRGQVTDTEVGTVASAYNNTLQSLQKIVIEVKQAADQVGHTSQLSESSVSSLKQEAQKQAAALGQVLLRVQEIMRSTEVVVSDAQQVEAAVQQANQTVKIGDTAMNRTVDGIMAIRATVADTNQRIKRLSESSQKISKIVNLISHFTTQTQLLSLNASIEATRAGKYGRGFAVVADEVRSLARQSAEAATEIEQLVEEIQMGTAEVSTAMETGIQQVAEGTTLVTDTRQNLTAVVEATGKISALIEGITRTTHRQSSEFKDVAATVDEATHIAQQTSQNSEQLAQAIQQLIDTARELQASTDKFTVA